MDIVGKGNIEELSRISINSNSWGNKAVVLGELMRYDLPVPCGIVLHTRLYEEYERIKEKMQLAEFKVELNAAIGKKLEEQKMEAPFMFRSSANVEGSEGLSCSGIFESYFCDRRDSYADMTIRVWESVHDKGTVNYLSDRINIDKLKMGVIIQPVCQGEVCGVIQTYDVINSSREMVVEYAPWRLEAVVDGTENSYRIILTRDKKIRKGTWTGDITTLERLQEFGEKIESILGGYVEVEFVIKENRVYILQTRKMKGMI